MTLNKIMQQRMIDINDTLSLCYEKLKAFQDDLQVVQTVDAKFSIRKRISNEILPSIKQYEEEYAGLMASGVKESVLSYKEAESFLSELQDAIRSIKKTEQKSDAIISNLKQIQKIIDEPMPATGKLQAAIPIIPGLISYQLEFDTHSALTNLWEKLKDRFKQ